MNDEGKFFSDGEFDAAIGGVMSEADKVKRLQRALLIQSALSDASHNIGEAIHALEVKIARHEAKAAGKKEGMVAGLEASECIKEIVAQKSKETRKPPQGEAIGMRHTGDIYPRNNQPVTGENAGRQCTIQCSPTGFTVIRGKGKRTQDRTHYHVPPALRPFADSLLTAYETGAWTTPPAGKNGKPLKWQQYCKGKSAPLRGIIQSQSDGKNGHTGAVRLWIV